MTVTTVHVPPAEERRRESGAPLAWPVGLGLLLAAVFLVLRVVSIDDDVSGSLSFVGVLGMASLLLLVPAPFVAIGAGALSSAGRVSPAARGFLVLGYASWEVVVFGWIAASIGGGRSCYDLDPCGAPLSDYLFAAAAVVGIYVAAWAGAAWVRHLHHRVGAL